MSYKSNLLSYLNGTNVNDEAVKEQDTTLGSGLSSVQPLEEGVMSVDITTKKITIPSSFHNVIVEGDHLSETIFFTIGRYADGLDLSQHKCIVRFVNAGNEYGESETYIAELSENTIKFGWTLDNKITRYKGMVSFTIQFETVNEGIQYQWQTQPANLTVVDGLNVEPTISDDEHTLYERVLAIMQNLSTNVGALSDLSTTTKTSIVAAINEVNSSGGSGSGSGGETIIAGVSNDATSMAVGDTLETGKLYIIYEE